MKILRAVLLTAGLIFIVGIFYWSLFMPKEEISERIYRTLKEQEKRADLFFKKVSFEEVSAGVKYWQLLAETAMVNKSTGLATLQKAEGTFFKKGKAVLKFRAPTAMWDMKKKEIYLDKPLGYDVALERKISTLIKTLKKEPLSVFNLPGIYKKELGYWFQANNLSWKLADQKLLCTGGILLNKGEITGYAEKLEGDVGLEKIRLEGTPRIAMSTPKTAPVTLEAQIFDILSAEDLFIAQGNPRVTWQDAKVSSQTARYFQTEKNLKLDGNVKIIYKDISAWGNSANYLTEEQKIILSGDARAKQGENKLSGDQVLISLKEEKISLIGKGKVIITE